MSARKVESRDQMLAGLKNAGANVLTMPITLPFDWDESGKFGNKNLGRMDGLRKYYGVSFRRGEKQVKKNDHHGN